MGKARVFGCVVVVALIGGGVISCSAQNEDAPRVTAVSGAGGEGGGGTGGSTGGGTGGTNPTGGGGTETGGAAGSGATGGTSPGSGGGGGVAGEGSSGTGAAGTGGSGGSSADGDPCGWNDEGEVLWVGSNIELCVPPTICNLEVCQEDLGTCVPDGLGGECVWSAGYDGLKTLPEAWATWYCHLETGCLGTIEGTTHEVRDTVQQNLNIPLCYHDTSTTCLGIVAFSPMLGGNSRLAKDASGAYLREWGLGLTHASGLCYEIEGMSGHTAIVAVTDRCAGYCACDPGRTAFEECGNCMLAGANDPADVKPSCPCVGDIAAMGNDGLACEGQQTCDWCMSNNHPHFDLDADTFNHVCADQAVLGSCQLARVSIVECMDPVPWPCQPGTWACFGQNPAGRIPGTYCCQ